jgi:hypothetical protein
MAVVISEKASYRSFVVSPLEDNQKPPHLFLDVLTEAIHLYARVPFQTAHSLVICVCIVPFSIPTHRGQVFYHAEAFYAQC